MRRSPSRRFEENDVHEEILPQVEQVLKGAKVLQCYQVPIGGQGNDIPVVPPE